MSTRNRWADQIVTMINQGRRNSATRIINRLRSGSLPGWAGGGPLFPMTAARMAAEEQGRAHFDEEDEDKINSAGERDPFPTDNRTPTIVQLKQEKVRVHDPELWRQQGNASVGNIISALYAKLIVVLGIAFPMSEVISTYIPPSFYDGFYLYLYFVSILFMACSFGQMIKFKKLMRKRKQPPEGEGGVEVDATNAGDIGQPAPDITRTKPVRPRQISTSTEYDSSDDERSTFTTRFPKNGNHKTEFAVAALGKSQISDKLCIHKQNGVVPPTARFCTLCKFVEKTEVKKVVKKRVDVPPVAGTNFGSFYLRIGAVAFGIGSVIYSALEFGQYFELKDDSKCYNLAVVLTPAVRMVFTFMQMYFIFLNSRISISKVSLLKQFGLMHMIGTNLAVWLNVLVQETKHEIVQFYHPGNETILQSQGRAHGFATMTSTAVPLSSTTVLPNEILVRVRRGLTGPHSMYECRRANIMGSLVHNASPFLFPCTIEYSLICAAVCFVMWKDMAVRRIDRISHKRAAKSSESVSESGGRGRRHNLSHSKSPHHYTVDCAGSNKGLFTGIFILVFTMMSLILNMVLIKHDDYHELATMVVNITELVLYSATTVAVLLGMCLMRQLRYESAKNLELDNILLIVAQSGAFLFNVFCIIGEHLAIMHFDPLSLTIPLICLVQIVLQTLFILDASKRVVVTTDHFRRKPGREVVTFLLVCNLAMWLINALEKSKSDSHPHQLHFYGVWAWTIITDFSMPLAIFYRFHSTVCLCEIWKKAYKLKHTSS